jgi:RNA polymerase sigma-70 factor (ECF subfamily)
MAPDEQIIAEILKGEKEKFSILVDRYQRAIFRFLRRMGLEQEAAQDVMQEAFIKAYNKLYSVREGGSFRCWLYAIAANQARNYLRTLSRQAKVNLDEANLYEDRDNPERTTEQGALKIRVERCLARLNDDQRRVVILRTFEDLSFKEIASTCGISLSNAKILYHRALKKMSGWLKIEVSEC